uniref:Poly(A)-specific ribonuclease PARN n=1 Tax=Anthurium amnicola TaxID=1678845 RepID=A0A1D1XU77_9ARAE
MRNSSLVRALVGVLTLTPHRSPPPRRCPFSTTPSGSGVAVTKVTKSNFLPALEELRALVRESDFVAFDLEMTGVTSAPWREAFEFDRSDVRYLKVKDSAEKFAVVQFGVCPFRWDDSKESFVAHPHNFYIFPRKELPIDGPSEEFHCQTTSIDFLAKYQFDFNTCIYEGISYLSRAQEAEALHNMNLRLQGRLANSMSDRDEYLELPSMRTADVLFTERIKIRFHEWRNGILKHQGAHRPEEGYNNSKTHFQTTFFKMRPAVTLNGFTSHQHWLIQMVIRKHFNDLVYVHATGDNVSEQKKVVYTDSMEDKAKLLKEVQNDLLNFFKAKITSAVGFRHVIDFLSLEEKLLVGHNCFLDIAHVYSKFVGPLPSSITEFASAVNKVVPHIVDTKHLLRVAPAIQRLMKGKSTSLSSAFSLLCPHIPFTSNASGSVSQLYVKIEVQEDVSGSNSGAKHEAGYDAFMTGCIFAQACSFLGIDFRLHSTSKELLHNVKLQKHINFLYPSWNGGTVVDLRTGHEVPESGLQVYKRRFPKIIFDNTVVLWGFPLKIKPKELKACLCKVLGENSVTSIFYLDAAAALVQFSKEELATDFLLLKDSLERNDDAISVLHPLSELLEGGRTCAANYEIYKQLCSSPVSKTSFAEQAYAVGIRWKTKISTPGSAGCNESPEIEIGNFSGSRESPIEGGNSVAAAVKNITGKVSSGGKESPHHISCEDLLDSLYAAHTLFGRQTNC